MSPTDFDVVIIGGGMVGSTLACLLGDSALRVALVENQAPQPLSFSDPLELRVSAINLASQRIFTALGVWPLITAQRLSPFRDMEVWDSTGSGHIHFDSAELGLTQLGHIIENRVIQAALWQRLAAFSNVTRLCPSQMLHFERHPQHIQVRLADRRAITTRLLVGADGAQSRVRLGAGIACHGWNYDQEAVVTTVRTEHFHQETAWQCFLPQGPLAFLPLSDGHSSIVWTTTPQHAAQVLALSPEQFASELELAFASRLGRILDVDKRASFTLRMQHAQHYTQARLALIGDAAHTIHPLAGQGLNLGLLDAASLAEVLLQAAGEKKDIGAHSLLRRYERWRKGDNLVMMMVMEAFKRGFGAEHRLLRWTRNLGLNLTHRLPPLKALLAEHAVGLHGDFPRVARASC